MSIRPDYLLWIDLETSGLAVDTLLVLEFGARLTRWDGTPVGEPFHAVCKLPDRVTMIAAVDAMHTASGLIDECCASETSEGAAWDALNEWFDRRPLPRRRVQLAGSGISHFDRRIIERRRPDLLARLDYRCYDVSNIRTYLGWDKPPAPHRALADVDAAIAEHRTMLNHLDQLPADSKPRPDLAQPAPDRRFDHLHGYATDLLAVSGEPDAAAELGRIVGYGDAIRYGTTPS